MLIAPNQVAGQFSFKIRPILCQWSSEIDGFIHPDQLKRWNQASIRWGWHLAAVGPTSRYFLFIDDFQLHAVGNFFFLSICQPDCRSACEFYGFADEIGFYRKCSSWWGFPATRFWRCHQFPFSAANFQGNNLKKFQVIAQILFNSRIKI